MELGKDLKSNIKFINILYFCFTADNHYVSQEQWSEAFPLDLYLREVAKQNEVCSEILPFASRFSSTCDINKFGSVECGECKQGYKGADSGE